MKGEKWVSPVEQELRRHQRRLRLSMLWRVLLIAAIVGGSIGISAWLGVDNYNRGYTQGVNDLLQRDVNICVETIKQLQAAPARKERPL